MQKMMIEADFFVTFFDNGRELKWYRNSISLENVQSVFPGRSTYVLIDTTANNTILVHQNKKFEGLKHRHVYQIPRGMCGLFLEERGI